MNKKFSLFAAACLIAASQVIADVDPRFKQGAIFENQGNYEMALGEYRSILAEQPKNAEAYLAAAKVRVKMKDLVGALANFRLAYKFDPTMSEAYEGAAKIYEANGDKKKAEAERAKDPKNNPVAAPVEKTEEAPAKTAEAPKEEPKKVEPAKPVEKVAEAKPVEKAPAEVKKVEPAKPVEKVAEAKPAEKAPAEVKKVEPAKPVETAEKAAPKVAEKSAETLPAGPFEKGVALFKAGKYAEAAPLWREALKKTPGHAGAYYYAGLTRFELGEYDKAEFNLKKGLEYKEEGVDANYFLACVYQKTKKTELEKKFLNNYLKKAAPNGKYRRKAEDRLAALNATQAAEAEKLSSTVAASSDSKTVAKVDSAKTAPAKPAADSKNADKPAEKASAAEPISVASAVEQFRSGNMEGALQIYKTLLASEQNPEVRSFSLLQMGNIYRELRDFNSAVNRYREIVQQFPDSEWAIEAERAQQDAIWLQQHASDLPRRK